MHSALWERGARPSPVLVSCQFEAGCGFASPMIRLSSVSFPVSLSFLGLESTLFYLFSSSFI